MNVDGVQVKITQSWVEDALRVRIGRQGLKIEDLFIVTHSPTETHDGDGYVYTSFGKIRIFWRADMPKDKLAQILHLSKFEYPRKGNKLVIANMTTNEAHQQVEKPKVASVERKIRTAMDEEAAKDAMQVWDELKQEGFADSKSPYDKNGDLVN